MQRVMMAMLLVLALASASAADLKWDDNSGNEKNMRVFRKDGPCAGSGAWGELLPMLPANTTTYKDASAISGKAYCYRVAADDSAYSNTVEVAATMPETPPGTPTVTLTVTAPTVASFSMSWLPATPVPVRYEWTAGFNDGTNVLAGVILAPPVVFSFPYRAAAAPAFACVKTPTSTSSCNGFTVPPKPIVAGPVYEAPIVKSAVNACTITLEVPVPDATSGWRARFRMDGGAPFGTVDATPPYLRARTTITPGLHRYYVEWLQGGVLKGTSPVTERSCP